MLASSTDASERDAAVARERETSDKSLKSKEEEGKKESHMLNIHVRLSKSVLSFSLPYNAGHFSRHSSVRAC